MYGSDYGSNNNIVVDDALLGLSALALRGLLSSVQSLAMIGVAPKKHSFMIGFAQLVA